jgi:hypothetical protein
MDAKNKFRNKWRLEEKVSKEKTNKKKLMEIRSTLTNSFPKTNKEYLPIFIPN